MATERKKFTFENLISIYFKNLHRIIFANALFAVPTLAVGALLYKLSQPLGYIGSVFITMLTVVICFPLYAGLTKVTRNIGRGEEKVNVFFTFTEAVSSNYKQFLVHSVLLYFILTIGVFSFRFYTKMAAEMGGMMLVLLISMIAIAIWMLFAFFYIPLMTVTFDLSLLNIYKNSALMAIGELKVNAVVVFTILILTAICGTPLLFSGGYVWLIIGITLFMLCCIYPGSANLISNFFVQNNMMMLITGKGNEVHDIKSTQDKLEKLKKQTENEVEEFTPEDIEKIKKSKEEYIFHNGKMMKREILIDMLNDKEQKNE